MPINEPRIYTQRKKWWDMDEFKRENGGVWFRKGAHILRVDEKRVEEFGLKEGDV